MLIAFDTETNGLPEWKKPSEDPSQPHIVQLAAVLRDFDQESTPIKVMNRIIRPDGWVIDESGEAFKTHGITQARALAEGVPIEEALQEFLNMVIEANVAGMGRLIGFNIPFDKRMIRIAEKRRLGGDTVDEGLPVGFALSSMKDIELSHRMTKHCKLPPTDKMMAAGRKTNKTPNLSEAFQHCYPGKKLDGKMHDALTDIKAAMGIYWWLSERGEVE